MPENKNEEVTPTRPILNLQKTKFWRKKKKL